MLVLHHPRLFWKDTGPSNLYRFNRIIEDLIVLIVRSVKDTLYGIQIATVPWIFDRGTNLESNAGVLKKINNRIPSISLYLKQTQTIAIKIGGPQRILIHEFINGLSGLFWNWNYNRKEVWKGPSLQSLVIYNPPNDTVSAETKITTVPNLTRLLPLQTASSVLTIEASHL